jgi:hypothetical protein
LNAEQLNAGQLNAEQLNAEQATDEQWIFLHLSDGQWFYGLFF